MNKNNDAHLGCESMIPIEIIELLNFHKITVNGQGLEDESQDSLLDEHELALAA